MYTHNPRAALRVTYLFNAQARISFGPLSLSCTTHARVALAVCVCARSSRKYFKNSDHTPKCAAAAPAAAASISLVVRDDVWKIVCVCVYNKNIDDVTRLRALYSLYVCSYYVVYYTVVL